MEKKGLFLPRKLTYLIFANQVESCGLKLFVQNFGVVIAGVGIKTIAPGLMRLPLYLLP